MGVQPVGPASIRFGAFELDPQGHELRKGGLKLRVQDQPLQVLLALLERPGEIVSRDELRSRLWPAGTFVEFDEGLNATIARLRQVLGDSAENPRFVQTVPRQGYRFIAPVAGSAGQGTQTGVGTAPDLSVAPVGAEEKVAAARPRWRPAFAAAGLALMAAALAYVFLGRAGTRGPSREPITSLAVLPLRNLSGDAEQEYFADGLTEALITDLSRIRALRVISRTSAMQYKGASQSLPQIARELGVDGVIEGSVQRSGDRVVVSAQLIRAATDTHLWADRYEREVRDILQLQRDVAQAIAREVQVAVAPEETSRLAQVRQVQPDAYEAYLKGRYWWNKRTETGYGKAREYFQEAIQKDPGYALAYSGLADAHATPAVKGLVRPHEAYGHARQAATKALELDDTLAAAHASLGYINTFYDWDWSGAEREFKRAIELGPGYASAHQWYAILLAFLGRRDEALVEARRARQLDPLSLIINRDLGGILYLNRDYDQAIEQLRKTLEMDPTFAQAHVTLGDVYRAKGLFQDAVAHGDKALELIPGETYGLAGLGRIYAFTENRAGALKMLHTLSERSKSRYVSAFHIAMIHLGLGDREKALASLERAYEERSAQMGYISVDPVFDSLRSDPRFRDLLRRVNLSGP